MEQIASLQEEHAPKIPAEYHYRYARVWNAVAAWDQSLAASVRYLELTGRDGDHYLDALTLMNRATARLEDIQRARELQVAAEAAARAADARARAARELALRAAADVIGQLKFVAILPGAFRMGSSDRDTDRYGRMQVRLTQAFEIARYEVTQSQWEAVMGETAVLQQRDMCDRCPALLYGRDTLQEVRRFMSMLNTADEGNWTYRLPTEAEWSTLPVLAKKGTVWSGTWRRLRGSTRILESMAY